MDTMKKAFFIILLMVVSFGMEAQQPLFFHNQLEKLAYQMEHPSYPCSAMVQSRSDDYPQKLDSVVGSNNFGWTNWKDIYAYQGDTIIEFSYQWEDQKWIPAGKTESSAGQATTYRWAEEDWEPYIKTTYEYDEEGRLILNMYYNGVDTLGEWRAVSKNEYFYDENGLLDTCLYSTIRNGNWRESERIIYSYNEQQQCIGLLFQMKGGWGPFANNWMDSYRYGFEYENGELVAELYYVASGWFGGGEMTLDSKNEYEFDTRGNMLRKTGSVFNETDWVVRDVYENRFDNSVDAATVKGLSLVWESMLNSGMGLATGEIFPLASQWLSCSVVSSNLDTEFTLYCSRLAEVNEQLEEENFKAYAYDGHLVVESMKPADVTVYDLLGRKVTQRAQASQCEFNLTSGLYVVCVGDARVKVIVK